MTEENLRFGGIERLYGQEGFHRLLRAHVCVVGIGGVGSWAVEALARTGVGELTLVDLDEVCVSNVNRQIHALDGEIGLQKVEAMARRVRLISPECRVHAVPEFFTEANADTILGQRFNFVLDAIDNVSNKCRLIAACRDKGLPIVTVGGAGGRRDPGALRTADLAFTNHDRLLQEVRRKLRKEFGFSRDPKQPFGIPCVFSPEPVVYPQRDGTVCEVRDLESDLALNCASGYGTATFVTGAFGFHAAAIIANALAQPDGAARPASANG